MVNISKRVSPMIGRLSELLVSGHRACPLDAAGTSPRSPLELVIQSPRGRKNYDLGGVGLGIVAALEKPDSRGRDVLAKYAIASTKPIRSNPIPVNPVKKNCDVFVSPRNGCDRREFDHDDDDEEYTFVTCHRPNNKSYTKVYYDGSEIGRAKRASHKRSELGIFNITTTSYVEESCLYPPSDFLNCCNLCKKKLHGKDIFMYRGEKAFCSSECRSSQILMDERKEQVTSRSGVDHVTSSSYSRGQIFLTGIVAAV